MPLKIDRDRFEARLEGRRVSLTRTQLRILTVLQKADGKVVSQTELMKRAWGYSRRVQRGLKTNTLAVNIGRLRRRLAARKPVIRTVLGAGYALIQD